MEKKELKLTIREKRVRVLESILSLFSSVYDMRLMAAQTQFIEIKNHLEDLLELTRILNGYSEKNIDLGRFIRAKRKTVTGEDFVEQRYSIKVGGKHAR